MVIVICMHVGMRGKRDDTDVLEKFDEKRGPVAGFMGVRGKKLPLVSSIHI